MSHFPNNMGEGPVVAGILSRLPVKSILRFMSVCKSWHSLISSSYFISSHHHNPNSNSHLILHHCDGFLQPGRPTSIRLFHLDGSNRHQSMLLNFGFESPHRGHLFVVGCVRGLICYAAVHRVGELLSKFILFNPELGYYFSVPAPLPSVEYFSVVKGFGFDDVSLDHKIFVAAPNSYVYLFSLKSNSWSCMPCQNSWDSLAANAVFVKGCFHWLSGESLHSCIMVFNIKSETFRRILFQERLLGDLSVIAGFGESSIGVVEEIDRPRSTLTHVWLMDQNGLWFKAADDVRVHKRSEGRQVLGFKNKHELLIRVPWRRVIVSQTIKNRKLHRVMSTEAGNLHCTVHTLVPSLFLLDKVIA